MFLKKLILIFLLIIPCLSAQTKRLRPEPFYVKASNDTLYRGEILRLEFDGPHGKEMIVMRSDLQTYFIAGVEDDYYKPRFTREEFANAKVIDLDLSSLKAYDYSLRREIFVFDKSGLYEFRIADNVETDVAQRSAIVEIYYYNTTRKK